MPELVFFKTNSSNPDFANLVVQLDKYLTVVDGKEHDFYHQYNSISDLQYVMVGYENNIPVCCGAIKLYDNTTMEVKRMYVQPTHRGKGIATALLVALENWAKDLGFTHCVLETGKRMQDAIALYHKNGYQVIANYGQYIGVENSVCMQKKLV